MSGAAVQVVVEQTTDYRSEDGHVDPRRVYQYIRKTGEAWAAEEATLRALEQTREPYLAQLKIELLDGGTPRLEAKMRALASLAYKAHLDAIAEGRARALRARVLHEAAKAGFEAMRTEEASRRAEMVATGPT